MIKLTPAICPKCGANIEVNKDQEKTICEYCRTPIMIEEAVQKLELSGSVKVAGIKSRDDYMEQAKKHFKVQEYNEAKECLNVIIVDDSFDIEAYCELVKNDIEILKRDNFDFESYIAYNSQSDLSEIYEEMIEVYERILKIDENNERANYLTDYIPIIDNYSTRKEEINTRMEKNKKILSKLNEDYSLIKSYNIYKEYNELMQELFHTLNCNYHDYQLSDYSEIRLDGTIIQNYKTKADYVTYESDGNITCEELDKNFEIYLTRIDSILENARQRAEEIFKKTQKEYEIQKQIKEKKMKKQRIIHTIGRIFKLVFYFIKFLFSLLLFLLPIGLCILLYMKVGLIITIIVAVISFFIFISLFFYLLDFLEDSFRDFIRGIKY